MKFGFETAALLLFFLATVLLGCLGISDDPIWSCVSVLFARIGPVQYADSNYKVNCAEISLGDVYVVVGSLQIRMWSFIFHCAHCTTAVTVMWKQLLSQ